MSSHLVIDHLWRLPLGQWKPADLLRGKMTFKESDGFDSDNSLVLFRMTTRSVGNSPQRELQGSRDYHNHNLMQIPSNAAAAADSRGTPNQES